MELVINAYLAQLVDRLHLTPARLALAGRWLSQAAMVAGVAYFAASVVSALVMSTLLTSAVSVFNNLSQRRVITASVNVSPTGNYRDIEHAIHERNLFNATGEYPDEKGPRAGGEKRTSAFDINGPCSKPSLNIELVGTIYLGGKDSVATVQEQGYSESDVYREGDLIVGNEQASVVKIERNHVILNNKGVKECLELASEVKRKDSSSGFPDAGSGTSSGTGGAPGGGGGRDCVLDEKYVHDELGPGFGTIIQKARLVPNTVDNQMNGFKIFAIDKTSLYGKTGLQDGDVITQVNETSLKLPEQGFALLQSFQDEKEVRIHILRNGTTPMMLTCRIK